jgi:transporter family-2 protein
VGGAGILWTGLAFGSGLLLAAQGPVNALLGHNLGAPIAATLVSVSVSAILALAILLASGQSPQWGAPPLWLYAAGGALGVVIVSIAVLVTPRLGASTFLACTILGQLAAGLVLDHLGLLGLQQHSISVGRIAAVVLIFAGALLMRFA